MTVPISEHITADIWLCRSLKTLLRFDCADLSTHITEIWLCRFLKTFQRFDCADLWRHNWDLTVPISAHFTAEVWLCRSLKTLLRFDCADLSTHYRNLTVPVSKDITEIWLCRSLKTYTRRWNLVFNIEWKGFLTGEMFSLYKIEKITGIEVIIKEVNASIINKEAN